MSLSTASHALDLCCRDGAKSPFIGPLIARALCSAVAEVGRLRLSLGSSSLFT